MNSNKFKLQGKTYYAGRILKNLQHWYDINQNNGHNWYTDANNFARQLSDKYDVHINQAAGIISALSPQKTWSENIKLANSFLSGKHTGHFRNQIKKAEQILLTDNKAEICAILHGLKTVNFFLNILLDPDAVTVDRHIIKAGLGKLPDAGITERQYLIIEKQLRIVVKNAKADPAKVQAVIWSNIRDAETAAHHRIEPDCPF